MAKDGEAHCGPPDKGKECDWIRQAGFAQKRPFAQKPVRLHKNPWGGGVQSILRLNLIVRLPFLRSWSYPTPQRSLYQFLRDLSGDHSSQIWSTG
jgi:hypothetical protein